MVPGLRDWRSAAMVAVSELVSGLDAELVRLGYTKEFESSSTLIL
jgi:hypothetical protein